MEEPPPIVTTMSQPPFRPMSMPLWTVATVGLGSTPSKRVASRPAFSRLSRAFSRKPSLRMEALPVTSSALLPCFLALAPSPRRAFRPNRRLVSGSVKEKSML